MRARGRDGGAVVAKTSKHSHALLHCRATAAWSSRLGPLCVRVAAQTGELALSRKVVSEKVILALRIHQAPSLVLSAGMLPTPHFVFHNFLCLLHHRLGSWPKTTHFLGATSGGAVISLRERCAACESRFLLTRCPFCCPLTSTRVTERHSTTDGRT